MKQKISKIVFAGVLGLMCITPLFSYAQDDCNKFGANCHVPGVNVYNTDEGPKSTLFTTIRRAINFALGLLATVATLICMYAGFKMLTSGGDTKGYDAGLKILRNAAIGLAIITLSWIIVSAIFWFIGNATGDKSMTGGSNINTTQTEE